ncbi:MAG: hypothetical protein RL385_2562 [Pseudomonadota bacterium]
MAIPPRKPATCEDLAALDEGIRAETVAGALSLSPSPLPRHAAVQRKAGRCLGGPFDDDDGRGGPGGWWLFAEVDVALGPLDIVRPDFAGWRRERLPKPGMVRPITVAPDWACEMTPTANRARPRAPRRAWVSGGRARLPAGRRSKGCRRECPRLSDRTSWPSRS